MSVFNDYALYYNALYQDKNYFGEVEFILDCLQKNGIKPKTLLDLGCGTGKHAFEMAKQGVSVHGVDFSQDMLNIGKEYFADIDKNLLKAELPCLEYGDARTYRHKDAKKFDVVTSLFHVMSYQNTEADALSVYETAKAHLNPEGYFLFDFWYGPCVLKERPEHREKLITLGQDTIRRVANPTLKINDNIVNVHYAMTINPESNNPRSFEENHSMRYWFLPELRYLASQVGFKVRAEGAWMSDSLPTDKDWGVWLLVQI